jgi:heme-degrading monooxygenase HmoA
MFFTIYLCFKGKIIIFACKPAFTGKNSIIMIARMWHGKVPKEKRESYHQYLLETGLNDYEKVEGNKGVFLLKRDEADITHFYTFSFWENIDAIKKFAGEDYDKAKYYPKDKNFLLEFESLVLHFEVLEKPAFFL